MVVLCVVTVGLVQWRHSVRVFGPSEMIQSLPPDQATHAYIDVDLLRRGGLLDLLAGSKSAEEPDYRKFVAQTGFDYRTDLHAVAAAFMHGDVYMAVRGRFEWKRLSEYAQSQGGQCRNTVCSMHGSTPDRNISFYPLRTDVLALAISTDEHGVAMIGPGQWRTPPVLPAEPVWVSVPSFVFSNVKGFPDGTHAFLAPLAQAQQVTFAIGPAGERLQVRLDVACNSQEAAATLAHQLSSTTDLLKKMLDRDHLTPSANDLSGVLVAGTFQQSEARVVGTWPIERGFIQALSSGGIQ